VVREGGVHLVRVRVRVRVRVGVSLAVAVAVAVAVALALALTPTKVRCSEGGVHRGVVGHHGNAQMRVVRAEGARSRGRLREKVLELPSTCLGLGFGFG
jgi:hypothetical protein